MQDISISLLKRVLNKIEHIKRSRSGSPNFESHEVECNELQLAIAEYMHLRGTTKVCMKLCLLVHDFMALNCLLLPVFFFVLTFFCLSVYSYLLDSSRYNQKVCFGPRCYKKFF